MAVGLFAFMKPSSFLSLDRIRFLIQRIRERLWVKPLALCVLSVGGVFLAKLAEGAPFADILPVVSLDSVESLLSVMASSMLVIATFAVGSMVAAYASASAAATPRSIPLVIADDVTQNALSAFIGAFIFSLVALIAVTNGYFQGAGLFTIFALTVWVFGIVIITFVRWVDRIARLGRVVNTIERVEESTAEALARRRRAPTLCATPLRDVRAQGQPLMCSRVGYVQHVDLATLQDCAEVQSARIEVVVLPGTFASPDRVLAYVEAEGAIDEDPLRAAFTIGRTRTFEDDPRFGLVALSEIADKALSPGVNDPGTAIDVIGTLVRLFTLWRRPLEQGEQAATRYDRVWVPELSVDDLFDDAFTAIARDGAGIAEVAIRLQKALCALAAQEDQAMVRAASRHSRLALARSDHAMDLAEDRAAVRAVALSETVDI